MAGFRRARQTALPERRQRRVLEQGTPLHATVVGLRRCSDGGDGERYEYALDVRAPDGVRRLGVRQKPVVAGAIRLGDEVGVRVYGDELVILEPRAPEGCLYEDWTLEAPPPEGVEDELNRAHKGDEIEVELLAVGPVQGADEGSRVLELRLLLPDGREVALQRSVPPYARHLVVEGARVPARLHRAKVRLDYVRLATEAARGATVG